MRVGLDLEFSSINELYAFVEKMRSLGPTAAPRTTVVRRNPSVSLLDDTPPGNRNDRTRAVREEILKIIGTAGSRGMTIREITLRLPDWATRISKDPHYIGNIVSAMSRGNNKKLRREGFRTVRRYWTKEGYREYKSPGRTAATHERKPERIAKPRTTWGAASEAVREAAELLLEEQRERGATSTEIAGLVRPEILKNHNPFLASLELIKMSKKGLLVKVKENLYTKVGHTRINRFFLPKYAPAQLRAEKG